MSNVGFFAKIKDNYGTKFSNLSISNGNSFTEKDGSTESDTLIHNAFIKYFDNINQEYPDWLEATPKQKQNAQNQSQQSGQQRVAYNKYQNAEFQPVAQNNSFNNSYSSQQRRQSDQQQQIQQQQSFQNQQQQTQQQSQTETRPSYQPRSSSRLQDMYNKSRQQGSGSSYNHLPHQPVRTNSSVTGGSRLRERMQQGQPVAAPEPEQQQQPTGRATWGRR